MILVYVLATFMGSLMLTELNGPLGIFAKLRHNTELEALTCFPCTSVWVGAVVAIYPAASVAQWAIMTLGFAGGAVVVKEVLEAMS